MYIQLSIKCEGNCETYMNVESLPPVAPYMKNQSRNSFSNTKLKKTRKSRPCIYIYIFLGLEAWAVTLQVAGAQ